MFERPVATRQFPADRLLQIAMPMGGIGAGCLSLNGHGGIQDYAIRQKPATSAVPDAHVVTDAAFAIVHVKGSTPITRLVEGPIPTGKIYDQGLQAQGFRKGGFEGLPRLRNCAFTAAYPFGEVELSDPEVPVDVRITGWNPFIPLDDRNSGMPCAILEYQLTNKTSAPVEIEFSYHLSHIAFGSDWRNGRNVPIPGAGVSLYNIDNPNHETFGSASLSVVGHTPKIKAMWMRGGWFDWLNSLWSELSTGSFRENAGNTDRMLGGWNGCSILMTDKLSPGESVTYPIVISWYFPNVSLAVGEAPVPAPATAPATTLPIAGCTPGSGCCDDTPAPRWKPYYSTQWKDAVDVAADVRTNYASLRSRTLGFQKSLCSSTLPMEAIDAIASNLAILKSPTVLRQENGNIWGWEGCFTGAGCCHGSCTHVWNYAQAMPHLFPKLERTLREAELIRSMDQTGHINFRAALPDGPPPHDYHPASDGQLGGIMKLYRDWQISGDRNWMSKLYPLARRSLEFAINRWDPDHRGGLFEPHHNTYDIEFWGPDAMCGSVYLGALSAAAVMADELKETADTTRYRDLLQKGIAFADAQLYNGEYFHQKVMWKELRDPSFSNYLKRTDLDAEEVRILEKEGPKYQYADGCLADGVIGAWMGKIYGLDEVLTRANVRSTLAAIFKHNFKQSLWSHVCTQRPGYALGDEPGLLICTWPRGPRPTLPFVYSDEVWTGIEYQVASHLIEEDLVEEGLTIIRGVRARYEGLVRNPFNEYECGSFYARAMASFAVLNSLSGFRYSAASQTLWFGPKLDTRPWRSFFSTATGYGSIALENHFSVSIEILEGHLSLKNLVLTLDNRTLQQPWSVTVTPSNPAHLTLQF